MAEQTEDKNYTKAEMAGMVQASLALCATCSHARGEHEGDKACLASWETGEPETRIKHLCRCAEFWPIRNQREDSLPVREWSVSFGGGLTLELDRRAPTELWESLRAGQRVTLEVEAEVVGKGFKQHKDFDPQPPKVTEEIPRGVFPQLVIHEIQAPRVRLWDWRTACKVPQGVLF